MRLFNGPSVAIKPENVRQVISGARVVGTSQQTLNGREAASAVFDGPSARYVLEGLTGGESAVSLRPENVLLPPGTRVAMQGLQSRPELNGRAGKVVSSDGERYTVHVAPDEMVRVRLGAVVALHTSAL